RPGTRVNACLRALGPCLSPANRLMIGEDSATDRIVTGRALGPSLRNNLRQLDELPRLATARWWKGGAMRCCPGSTVDTLMEKSPPESLYEFGTDEALKHKWNRSYHAGRDVGQRAVDEWVAEHWNTFVRARWVEHLEGRRFW